MNKDFIIESLKNQISGFKAETKSEKVGRVIEVGDGIARISGLSDAMASEMLEFHRPPKRELVGTVVFRRGAQP